MTAIAGTAGKDSEGDIVLVVGNDQVRIFASSCHLSIASKPFARMLGLNFKEGHIDKASTRREISLPGDKSSAMEILCSMIHHRYQASFMPTATDVYGLRRPTLWTFAIVLSRGRDSADVFGQRYQYLSAQERQHIDGQCMELGRLARKSASVLTTRRAYSLEARL